MAGRHERPWETLSSLPVRYWGQLYPPHEIRHDLATFDIMGFEKEMGLKWARWFPRGTKGSDGKTRVRRDDRERAREREGWDYCAGVASGASRLRETRAIRRTLLMPKSYRSSKISIITRERHRSNALMFTTRVTNNKCYFKIVIASGCLLKNLFIDKNHFRSKKNHTNQTLLKFKCL